MISRFRQSVVLLAFVAAQIAPVRGAFASEPAALAARAAAIDRPAVIGAARSGPIAFGRAVVTPRAGARVWLLGTPERPCALWLDGGGSLVYTIDDPVALPVSRRNLKSASALRFDDGAGRLTVREELKSAVIWGWEVAGAAVREAGSGPGFPAWADLALEKRRFPPPSSALLEAQGNGVPGVVYALLDGEKESLLLHADPRPARAEEKLTVLWKLPPLYGDFAGDLEPYQLARQPIGRTFQAARPQEMIASRYDIAVEQTGKRTVRVRSKVSLKAARAGISVWAAELDHETTDDGTVYGVRVLSASVDGKPAAAHFENGALLVELGRVLGAGGQVTVEVISEGEHASRPNQDSFWWLGFGAWYPRPVERRDLAAEYEISIDVAGPWIPYASGKTVKRESDGARNRLVTRLAGPMQAPVVTVGSYSEVSEAVDGVRVNVASYAFEKPEEATRLIRNFGVLRQCLEKLFQVPYPFEEVDILEVNSWGFGMAPAGVVLVTREAFTKTGMVRALGESSMSVNEIFAHEIAHAYWANVVKYDSGAEQWLSESFSEYTSGLCLAMAAESEKEGKRLLDKLVNQWRGNASQIRSGVAIATANDLAFKDDLDAADRIGALYARGPLVLHAIRGELARQRGSEEEGDRYFSAFMRAVVKNFALRSASTEDLIGILEQITKQPWRPFFDRHVYGPETPKVK